MGLGLIVSIGGMRWSWGWSADTGEGATSGLGRTLVEAVVIFAAAGLGEPSVCWGLHGQSALVAAYGGLHALVSCGDRWHEVDLGWPGGLDYIVLTLLVGVLQCLWLRVVRALSSQLV